MTEHGFETLADQHIPELNLSARLYRHEKTGAELLSLICDDENKSFGISFRTPPADSTGVAHILEHSVLCGSRKYPLKDPFVELIKGSLNTFLNAFTYPDKTCYPVASQNLQDFYNLVDVYLDTVFYPRLAATTFKQQGWHYELESPTAPLTYKGVVFNEMKGACASPDRMLYEAIQQSLFPDNAYAVDSGGDPAVIPNLTHEGLVAFHRAYYHPSNSRTVFYGNDDPVERLRLMNAWFSEFERADTTTSEIAIQPFIPAERTHVGQYVVSEDTDARRTNVTQNWLLADQTNPELVYSLEVLSHILVGTPASPLRKALIDSGMGEDTAGSGLEGELRQLSFSIGLKGIASDDAGRVQKLIFETLESLARNGIDPLTIRASLNTVEFALRENNTGSFPRGLSLMLRALVTWLHGGDPLQPLNFAAPLERVKAAAASPGYFEALITKYFLNGMHRTLTILEPSSSLAAEQAKQEEARLAAARASMTGAEIEAVVADTRALRLHEETPDAPEVVATIPSLELKDIDRFNQQIPIEIIEKPAGRVLFHNLFSQGIVYLDLGLNLRALPADLLPLAPLFGRALIQMGTQSEDFVRITQRMGAQTGGIRSQVFTSPSQGRPDGAAWLFLRGKAVAEDSERLTELLADLLYDCRLDNQERFLQLALEEKAGLEASISPGGSSLVATRLGSRFNDAMWAAEQTGGISYIYFVRDLINQIQGDWNSVLRRLETMRSRLLSRDNLIYNVTCDGDAWDRFAPSLDRLMERTPDGGADPASWQPAAAGAGEIFTIPTQVNYVGKAANLYALGLSPHGAYSVAARFLSTTYMWEKVRVQGGAYGGFCRFDRLSGVFRFLSYRDPNFDSTLEVYDAAAEFLRTVEVNEKSRVRTIIGTISDIDQYMLPDAKGYASLVRWLVGETDASRQAYRDQVLSAGEADFRKLAEVLQSAASASTMCAIASEEVAGRFQSNGAESVQVARLM